MIHKVPIDDKRVLFCGDGFYEKLKEAMLNITPEEFKEILKST